MNAGKEKRWEGRVKEYGEEREVWGGEGEGE